MGHNIIIPLSGDYTAVDCDIALPRWLLEKCTMRIHRQSPIFSLVTNTQLRECLTKRLTSVLIIPSG